jgi:hypothetical protein
MSELTDEASIVVVRDLPGPVVELELFQRSQRPIAFLFESEPRPSRPAGLGQRLLGRRAAQERPGDEPDCRDRQEGAQHECGREH